MKYGLMCYNHLENVGNEIQSIAARRFLPQVDYYVDFNNLASFKGEEEFKMIMNAWYLHEKTSWPPIDENINPLLISMHLNTNNVNTPEAFLADDSRDFLLKYGPVGARDLATAEFLNENDIPSYFSGCLTLTLKGEDVEKEDYIVLVDVSDEVVSYVRQKTDKKVYVVSQSLPTDLRKRVDGRYHYMQDRVQNSQEKFFYGECLLNLYQRASCVITKRLHVAFPCLALETPVMILNDDIINGNKRFEGLKELLHFYSFDDYKSNYNIFDVNNPPLNKKEYLKIRKDLIKRVKAFTSHENDSFNTFDYNKFSALFLSKLNSKLIENNHYAFSLEDRIKVLEKEIQDKNNQIEAMKKEMDKNKSIIKEMKGSNSWKLTKPLRELRK